MEYIEGDTLGALARARAPQRASALPAPIALRVVARHAAPGCTPRTSSATTTASRSSLVHRDVSPQNMLVGVDGIARITDFGVARAASRLTATRVGQLKGKIAYMAPEQAPGVEDVDRARRRVLGGVVLWEVLAPQAPVQGRERGGDAVACDDRARAAVARRGASRAQGYQ